MALTEDQQRKLREMNERSLRAANQTALSTNSTIRANRERLAAHDRALDHQKISMGAMGAMPDGVGDLTRKAWTEQVDHETAEKHAQAERDFAATGEADLLPGMPGESDEQKKRRALGERQAELRALGRTQGSILIGDQTDEKVGRQNLIDIKNRQAHEAINQQYGDLIRQGKASPFHALLAHQEQQRRYEEKTRLQGDYEKLQKEQDERQKAAQAAAEDLHKRMGSSTYAVFTALDRLNDPDLSDSECASTLSVAAAAAQKLGDQFVENKYGADSGYRSEVVKVEGENPATGRMAVGYEIMVKDRAGNPVMDYRTGRPLVMKLDADRARKAMEQHFGYEFRTDENGNTVFGVGGEEGGTVSDPTGRQFSRQDFGSMQVGDRLFGGQYSAKTREEMEKQQQADDAHALTGEKIESSKSSRKLAENADKRAADAAARDERMSELKEEAQRLQNQYENETMPDRKQAVKKQLEQTQAQIDHLRKGDELAEKASARADSAEARAERVSQLQEEAMRLKNEFDKETDAIRKEALQKQIDHIDAQISHLQTTDTLATNADRRADAAASRAVNESRAKIESIQAETALTREKTAQLVKAGQEAKAAGAAEQEKFVRDTAASLMKDEEFRARYKDADEAARVARRVARNLAGLADSGGEGSAESGGAAANLYKTDDAGKQGGNGRRMDGGEDNGSGNEEINFVTPEGMPDYLVFEEDETVRVWDENEGRYKVRAKDGNRARYFDSSGLNKVVSHPKFKEDGRVEFTIMGDRGAYRPDSTIPITELNGKKYNINGRSSPAMAMEILARMGVMPVGRDSDGDPTYSLTKEQKETFDHYISTKTMPKRKKGQPYKTKAVQRSRKDRFDD